MLYDFPKESSQKRLKQSKQGKLFFKIIHEKISGVTTDLTQTYTFLSTALSDSADMNTMQFKHRLLK